MRLFHRVNSGKCKLHIAQQVGKRAVESFEARNNDIIPALLHMCDRCLRRCCPQAPLDAVAHHGIAHFFCDRKAETRNFFYRVRGVALLHLQNERAGDKFAASRCRR